MDNTDNYKQSIINDMDDISKITLNFYAKKSSGIHNLILSSNKNTNIDLTFITHRHDIELAINKLKDMIFEEKNHIDNTSQHNNSVDDNADANTNNTETDTETETLDTKTVDTKTEDTDDLKLSPMVIHYFNKLCDEIVNDCNQTKQNNYFLNIDNNK